ncbi:MAG: gliding motility-associated C-terminal domain-containing protein [Bacteroidota bacterium]
MNTTRFLSILSIWLFLGVSVYAQDLDRPTSKPNTSERISSQLSNIHDSNGVAAQQAANSFCLQSGNIDIFNVSADQPADEGPCFPDDTMIVCFQVQSYQQTDGNWLQAILPEFEPCWYIERNPITNEPLQYHVPPPIAPDGQWQWFSEGEVLYNNIPNGSLPGGTPLPEGWYFTGQVPGTSLCFDPSDPDCTWGDSNAGTSGLFEICVVAGLECSYVSTEPVPCGVSFKTYSDSEVGAFENPGCQFDEKIEDAVLVICCEDPTITNDTTFYEVCSGNSANITLYSDMDPETTFAWTVIPDPMYGATDGSGPVIDDVYQNFTSAPVTVQYEVIPTCAGGCVGRGEFFYVTIFPAIRAEITGTNIICPDECAFLSASTESNQAPFTYQWSNGSTEPELFCVPAGYYEVTITDRNGCSDHEGFIVSEVPDVQVFINILGPDILCPGETTTLSAEAFGGSGDYEYFWSTGSTESIITVDQPGNYSVEVHDVGNGCFPAFDQVTIFGTEEFTVDIDASGPSSLCTSGGGQTVTLDAQVSGGSGNFDYDWSNGDGASNITVDMPGSYTVAVTDQNGCTQNADYAIAGIDPPQLSISPDVGTEICADFPGDGINLSATTSGGTGDFEYSWTDGSTGPSTFVSSSSSIGLTLIDQQSGCVVTASPVALTIHPPIELSITPDSDTELCASGPGDGITLSASPSGGSGDYDFEWSSGDGSATTFVEQSGSLSLTVIDQLTGCSAEANSAEFTIHPPIELALATDAGTSFCATAPGDGILVSADISAGSGDYEYSWTDESSDPTTFLASTGSIGLELVDLQTGCSASSEPILLTIHPPIDLEVTSDLGTEICAQELGDGITLSASPSGGSGDYVFNWSNGADGSTTLVQQSGPINLSVTDQQTGCSAVAVAVNLTIHPPLELQLATDMGTEICATIPGEGITAWAAAIGGSGQYAYNWSEGDQGDYAFVDETTTISVEVVDQQTGCVGVSEPTELIIHPPIEVSILADAPIELCADSDQWPIQLSAALASNPNTFDFEWSTGSNQSDISVDEGGAFTLLVTDQGSGCEGTAELTIVRHELPEVSLTGPVEACAADEQVCLDVAPLGGSWSSPDVNGSCLDLSDLAIGTQVLDYTYTDENGCSASASHQLSTFAAPELPTVNCTATTASVSFDWSGPSGQTYTINGDPATANTYQFSGLAPEQTVSMELIVSTEGPCLPISQVYQCETEACPPVTLELTSDLSQPFCTNDLPDQPIQLGLQVIGDEEQVGTGTWSGIGLVDAELGTIDLSDPAFGEGEYSYEYTYQIANCTYTTAQTMRLAPPPTVDAGEDQTVGCNFDGLDLLGIASTGTQLTWLNASGQEIGSQLQQTIDQTGLYQLQATDPTTGCSASDEILVSLTENLPEEIDIMAMPETCHGDGDSYIEIMDVFGGTAPYTFMLDQASVNTSGRWDDLTADSYQITVVDVLGCQLTTVVELVETPSIEVDLADEVELFFGDVYYLDLDLPLAENLSIQWFPQIGVECMDAACAEVMLNPLLSQVYTVEVENERGCFVTEDISVIVRDGRAVYLPTAFSPNEDGNNDQFMIFPLQEEVRVSQSAIFDRWGNMVSSSTSDQADRHFIWDGKKAGKLCSVGVYVYQVELTMPDGEREVVTGEVTLVR